MLVSLYCRFYRTLVQNVDMDVHSFNYSQSLLCSCRNLKRSAVLRLDVLVRLSTENIGFIVPNMCK